MSPLPQKNTPWAHPADPNTVGGGCLVNTTSHPSDQNIELPHGGRRQQNTNLQRLPNPQHIEIQEIFTVVPLPAMPQFAKAQSSSISDSPLSTAEQHPEIFTHTTILSEHGAPCLTSKDPEIDDVEHGIALPMQTPSAADSSAVHTAQKHSVALSQIPAEQQTSANCDQCLGKAISCTGGQLNVRWCDACRKVSQSCSLHPRKHACQQCGNFFMTPADVTRHNTKYHTKLIPKASKRTSKALKAPKMEALQFTATHNTPRASKRLRQDSKTSSKPEVPHVQIDLAHEVSNRVQGEMPHPDELYGPEPPVYRPTHEPPEEVPDSPLSRSPNNFSHSASPDQSRTTCGRSQLFCPNQNSAMASQKRLADIYIQFPDRVMEENHVERSLRALQKEVENYENFIRCKDPRHTNSEIEDQFSFLTTTRPFVLMKDVQKESHDFFASQPSRLVVLWRSMLEVHPTTSLRDELIRFDLEGLELPAVICGTLAYALLRIIFDEPDQLRAAERTARLQSVKVLYGVKFATESIKHDELYIYKDKKVDRELRKSARELSELQFYDLLYPLTHWNLANPTTQMRDEHLRYLGDVALKSLRLSRELQARTTENYSYFWPRPGESFNHQDHIGVDEQAIQGSQVGRIVKWTLMFGVKANREGHEKVYAKAVVMTMEA